MALAVVFAGCAAPAVVPEDEPSELDELRVKLRGQGAELEAQRRAHAQDLYRLAERRKDEGDLEGAKLYCEKALVLTPDFVSAQALWLELALPTTYDALTCRSWGRDGLRHAAGKIEEWIVKGNRAYNAGELDDAIMCYRTAIAVSRWFLAVPELEDLQAKANGLLDRARAEKK